MISPASTSAGPAALLRREFAVRRRGRLGAAVRDRARRLRGRDQRAARSATTCSRPAGRATTTGCATRRYDVTGAAARRRERDRRAARRRLVPRPARLRRRQARTSTATGSALLAQLEIAYADGTDRRRRHRRRLARRDRPDPPRPTSTTASPTTRAASGPAGRRRASTTATGRRARSIERDLGDARRARPARRCGATEELAGPRGAHLAVRAGRSSTSARTSSAALRIRVSGDRRARRSRCATPRCSRTASSASGRCAPPTATDRYTLRGRRRRGLGAALHLPRLPLRRGRRLAGRARPGRRRGRRAATPTWSAPAGSSAPTRCSTGCTRTSSGACAATSSTSRPTARSATSGSAGPATSRSSRPTARFLYDCAGFLASWLRDLAAEQTRRTASCRSSCRGSISAAVRRAARRRPAGATPRSIVPWVLYQRFGDVGRAAPPVSRACAPGSTALDRRAGDRPPVGQPASSSATGSTRPRRRTAPRQARPTRTSSPPPTSPASPQLLSRDRRGARRGRATPRSYAALAASVAAGVRATSTSRPHGRLVERRARPRYALALEFDLLAEPSSAAAPASGWSSWSASSGYRIATGFVGTPLICDALRQRRRASTTPTGCCTQTRVPVVALPGDDGRDDHLGALGQHAARRLASTRAR